MNIQTDIPPTICSLHEYEEHTKACICAIQDFYLLVCHTVYWIGSYVLAEPAASIFRVEE
jgi:hypothetical protein